jgi:hypothetical protein
MEDVGHVVVLRPGEHVHADPSPAELARQVTDVHVHPAGVFPTQCRQRTGMIGQHGHAHAAIIPDAAFLAKELGRLV